MTWTIIIPIIGIIALLVAAGLAANVKKQSEGKKLQQQSMKVLVRSYSLSTKFLQSLLSLYLWQ